MAGKDALAALRRAGCTEVSLHVHFTLSRSGRAQLRRLGARGRKAFAWFSGSKLGPGLGATAQLGRHKGDEYHLTVAWFETETPPPAGMGRLAQLASILAESEVEGKDAQVVARFEHSIGKVRPLLPPIPAPPELGAFDQIVGFTGVKNDPRGNRLYELSTRTQGDRLINRVVFTQPMPRFDEFPQGVLERAEGISALVARAEQGDG